jgi:cobalamin biosynthesis protein CobD/CbiB
MKSKGFWASFILFDIVTIATLIFWKQLSKAGVNPWVIIGGNAVLFVVTILSMYMNAKAIQHQNTHGFMRNVYGGFLLKFTIIIVAAVAYIAVVSTPDKTGLLICAGLYFLYTFFGTRSVLNHKNPVVNGNGKSTV